LKEKTVRFPEQATRMVGVAAWNLPSRRRYTPYPQQKQYKKQQLYTCNRRSSIGGTCFRFVSHQSSPQPRSFGLRTMTLQSTAKYDSSREEENESKEPNTSTTRTMKKKHARVGTMTTKNAK
jgi:hypothetical protein